MLKKIGLVLAALVGAVAIAALVGLFLPSGHVAAMKLRVDVSPDSVWQAITNYTNFPQWRSDVERVEALETARGWTEFSSTGPLSLLVDEEDAPRKLVMRIAPGGPFGGTWTYELEGDSTSTSVVITERGEVYNPVFRTISQFMDQRATIRTYLTNLAERFGSSGVPEVVGGSTSIASSP